MNQVLTSDKLVSKSIRLEYQLDSEQNRIQSNKVRIGIGVKYRLHELKLIGGGIFI